MTIQLTPQHRTHAMSRLFSDFDDVPVPSRPTRVRPACVRMRRVLIDTHWSAAGIAGIGAFVRRLRWRRVCGGRCHVPENGATRDRLAADG